MANATGRAGNTNGDPYSASSSNGTLTARAELAWGHGIFAHNLVKISNLTTR